MILFLVSLALAETTKVAVIDTGLNLSDNRFTHLCVTGHKDFTSTSINDVHGHGTHVYGLIQQYAGNKNYCVLIYKYYSDRNNEEQNLKNEILSIREAIKNGAKIINFSAGGNSFSKKEYSIIRYHPEIAFVVASGNDGIDLDSNKEDNQYFPTSYALHDFYVEGKEYKKLKNILVVGGKEYTNFSKSMYIENSIDVLSFGIEGNKKMSGSSMSTAIHTGRIIP